MSRRQTMNQAMTLLDGGRTAQEVVDLLGLPFDSTELRRRYVATRRLFQRPEPEPKDPEASP